jgi:hypothetical protein
VDALGAEAFSTAGELEQQLLSVSPRQIDRRLKAYKVGYKRRGYEGTRPGRLLKRQIATKTDRWEAQVVSPSGTASHRCGITAWKLIAMMRARSERRLSPSMSPGEVSHASENALGRTSENRCFLPTNSAGEPTGEASIIGNSETGLSADWLSVAHSR